MRESRLYGSERGLERNSGMDGMVTANKQVPNRESNPYSDARGVSYSNTRSCGKARVRLQDGVNEIV